MKKLDWKPLVVLTSVFLLNVGFFAYALAPASILPMFSDAFDIGKPAASSSISAIFLTWAILQIPGGYILDRHENRQLLFIATFVFILASISGLLVRSYSLFLLTRLISGGSAVFIFVGSVNVLSQVVPESRQATVLGVFIASPPFGIAIAQYTGPLLAELFWWQAPFLAYSLASLVGLSAAMILLNAPIKAAGRVNLGEFTTALKNPSIILVSIASFCTYTVWTFLLTWMPTYGTEVLQLDLAAAGAAAALVPLGGIVSRPAGGWISEQLGGRLKPVIIVSFLTSILFLFLLSNAPSATGFAVLLALAGAAVNLCVGLYLVFVNSLADLVTQGTSLSVLITFSQIGNLTAPVVGGVVIDQISWSAGFGFAAILAIIGLITILVAPSTT